MKKKTIIQLLIGLFLSIFISSCTGEEKMSATTIYDFSVENSAGETVKLSQYKDKVILIVNTASKCGFTPQFEGLEKLYKQYKDQGLMILGFPCNQFLFQDPGSDSEIVEFCQLNYGVTFPMFSKINVNGRKEATLYKFLKTATPDSKGKKIKWNFTKFLIDKKGEPVRRYEPTITPKEIESEIVKLLNSK